MISNYLNRKEEKMNRLAGSFFFLLYLDRLGMTVILFIHKQIRYGGHMEKQIRNYVNHYFRFDHREGLEDLKEEIISNLIDRYNSLIEDGEKQEKAYVESIKSMGDFQAPQNEDVPLEFQRSTPALPEYALITSVIFAIFSTILLIINGAIGAIFTAFSISLYAVGSYYLYAKAMHVKSADMDIELYKAYLRKIFKYMKTCFSFWTFNLAFISAVIIQSIATFLTGFMQLDNQISPDQLLNLVGIFIMISIISFVLTFVVFTIISYKIYMRLKYKYYLLTGEKQIKGKLKDSLDFMKDTEDSKMDSIYLVLIYVFGVFINAFGYLLYATIHTKNGQWNNPFITQIFKMVTLEFGYGLLLLIGPIGVIFSFIWYYKKNKNIWVILTAFIIQFVTTSFSIIMLSNPAKEVTMSVNIIGQTLVLLPGVLSMFYGLFKIISYVIKNHKTILKHIRMEYIYLYLVTGLLPTLILAIMPITIENMNEDTEISTRYINSFIGMETNLFYSGVILVSVLSILILSSIGLKRNNKILLSLQPIVFNVFLLSINFIIDDHLYFMFNRGSAAVLVLISITSSLIYLSYRTIKRYR